MHWRSLQVSRAPCPYKAQRHTSMELLSWSPHLPIQMCPLGDALTSISHFVPSLTALVSKTVMQQCQSMTLSHFNPIISQLNDNSCIKITVSEQHRNNNLQDKKLIWMMNKNVISNVQRYINTRNKNHNISMLQQFVFELHKINNLQDKTLIWIKDNYNKHNNSGN